MIHPKTNETQSQSLINQIDTIGRSVFRPAPWKLALALASGLAMPDIGLRLLVATLAVWFALRSLPRTPAEKSQRASQLPTASQVNRVAKWSLIASATAVLAILVCSVLAHVGV